MIDPIADMLTRIRNAQRAGLETARIPASRLKLAIANILVEEGFLSAVSTESIGSNRDDLIVSLKYIPVSPVRKDPAIHEIHRVSKEGRRVYVKKGELRKVKNGFGMSIVSTSQGLMTGLNASRRGLGGEYICEVW